MAEMKLIGSKIVKVLAERNIDFSGKLSMKTNIQRKEVEKVKGSKDTLSIGYVFGIDYKDLGKINVEGILYISGDSKTIKEIIKTSEKKDYEAKEQVAITNLILQKASVRAMQLEEELGLPIHIKLPSISISKD